jgi:hypothetical protein
MSHTGEPRLERATPADAARVWELQRAAFQEYLGVQTPPPSVWRASVADVEQWLRDGGGLLAWLDDALAGSIVWSYRGPVLYVQHVSVHPAYRRRTHTVPHPLGGAETLTGMEKRLSASWPE